MKSWSIIDQFIAANITFTPLLLTIHCYQEWYKWIFCLNTGVGQCNKKSYDFLKSILNRHFLKSQTFLHRLPRCGHSGRGKDLEYHRGIIQGDDFQWWCQPWLPHLQTFIPELSAWKTTQWSWTVYFWISGSEGEILNCLSTYLQYSRYK